MSTITEKLKWLIEADATSAVHAFKQTGDAAEKELKRAETSAQKVGGQLTKVGAGAIAFSGILGGALIKAAGSFEDLALKAGQMSDATGLSVDQASRWIEISDDMGIGADTIETALGKMNKTLGASPDKFDELGIHIATAKGGVEDVNGTFLNVIARLNEIEDPARRAAAAATIFGKGWQGSAELLKLSTDDIKTQLASVSDQKVINEEELQKAKDYRADLDHLKDSAEDLALAIGQGAAPVIGAIASAVGTAVQAFTDLDDVSHGAAGGILASGAAALGTVGAFSVIAGQALKIKDRFTDASGSMTTFGKTAVVGAGLAAGAMLVYTLDAQDSADATANLKASIEDLSRVSDADLLKTFIDTIVKGYFAEKDLKQTTDELAQSNIEGAQRVRDMIEAHIAAGTATQNEKDSIDPLVQSIKDEQAARLQGKTTTDEYKGSTDDATAATKLAEDQARALAVGDDVAKVATDALKASQEEAARKTKVFSDALQTQIDKLDALYPKQYDAVQAKYDYRQASEDTMVAVGNLNTVLGDHKSKEEDVKTATDGARDAILGASEKYATMEGAATGSEGAIRRQIQSLKDQAAGLAPGSDLRLFLEQYIADLAAIPSNISTIMDLHVSQGSTTTAAGDVIGKRSGRFASGTNNAPPGVALVGENGPELVVMGGGEKVIPNGALGGTATYNITVNGANMSPDQLVAAIKKYESRNGPGWRS